MVTLMLALCLAHKNFVRHALRMTNRSGLFPAHRFLITCAFVCLISTVASPRITSETARESSAVPDSVVIENNGSPVEIDGKPILLIYAPIGGFTPNERASAIQQRIIALSRNTNMAIEAIHAEDRGTWTEILAGSNRIMGITEGDAKAAERPRAELAEEYTEVLRLVVKQYREDHTWRRYWRGTLYAALASACLVVLLVILILCSAKREIQNRAMAGSPGSRGSARASSSATQAIPRSAIHRHVSYAFLDHRPCAFAELCDGRAALLSIHPIHLVSHHQLAVFGVRAFGKGCVGYIPNLLLILCICLVTSYLIKVNKYIFQEISNQRVTIRGFYPDWAEPTAKLTRTLILAAAAIVVFPYLPGSESPAFKGISVFLGVLLSLGSTSAVAHAVAGTILTYMRAFQVGDFVRIENDVGEIIEKTLLITRICTQKNEVVTIPNGTVLGGVVVNYSAEARQKGVIFHTTVTIGYNAPWRQVHELLISAALATEDVLWDPAPFVVQTALNDFYVGYELNASTVNPKNMQNIYSKLHQNIEDKFNEAGVEINSPHYTSLRDGNRTTIPDAYLPANYRNPVFEVQEVNGSQMSPTGVKHP